MAAEVAREVLTKEEENADLNTGCSSKRKIGIWTMIKFCHPEGI